MQKINYKKLLPLIIVDNKTHQILLNDNERKQVFNFIADLRGRIELEEEIFCEVLDK